jgi:hypothetical protein
VLPGDGYYALLVNLAPDDNPDLRPQMLLVNAVRHDAPGRARLVKMLLQRGAGFLQETFQESGENALSTAARLGDAEVRPWFVQVKLSNVWLYQIPKHVVCCEREIKYNGCM